MFSLFKGILKWNMLNHNKKSKYLLLILLEIALRYHSLALCKTKIPANSLTGWKDVCESVSLNIVADFCRCSSVPESWVRWRSCVTTVSLRSSPGCSPGCEVTLLARSTRNCKTRGEHHFHFPESKSRGENLGQPAVSHIRLTRLAHD